MCGMTLGCLFGLGFFLDDTNVMLKKVLDMDSIKEWHACEAFKWNEPVTYISVFQTWQYIEEIELEIRTFLKHHFIGHISNQLYQNGSGWDKAWESVYFFVQLKSPQLMPAHSQI